MDATVVTTHGLTITLRPATPDDERFLHRLYADRRSTEMALLNWSEEEARGFVDMQFRAQQHGYVAAFPDADHRIVMQGAEPVGRILVDRRPHEHLVVDVAVLSPFRPRGVGSALMRTVLATAATDRVPVRLTVSRSDPQLVSWYERLGFRVADQRELDVSMVSGD